MRKKLIKTLALLLIVLLFSSGCVLKASNTDTTVTQNIEVVQTTKEPTETAVATTTAKSTQKVTATPAPTATPIPTAVPTTAQPVQETTAETTAATTKETTKPTPKPTKETTVETEAPAETAAPPVETAPPQTAAPAYAENCDAIRNQIVQYCVDNGLWFPDAEAKGSDEKGWSLGYASADNQYAESFIRGKIIGDVGIQSVNCWIADGYIYISSTVCMLPAA